MNTLPIPSDVGTTGVPIYEATWDDEWAARETGRSLHDRLTQHGATAIVYMPDIGRWQALLGGQGAGAWGTRLEAECALLERAERK